MGDQLAVGGFKLVERSQPAPGRFDFDRVEVDGTSKLSYHLGELTGTFLRKHENGYAFTHAGERMVRFILAENYRQPSTIDAIETDGTCLDCGESGLRATLQDQYFMLVCGACKRANFSYKVTPAQVRAHRGGDLIDAVTWTLVADLLKLRQGVCPDCSGRIDTGVQDASELAIGDAIPVFSLGSTGAATWTSSHHA